MAAQIRRATRVDVEAIAELRAQWIEEESEPVDDRHFLDDMEKWLFGHSDSKAHWIAIDGIAVVGFISLTDYEQMPKPGQGSGHWGYLGNAYVHADFRDQGIGARMVEAVIRYARAKGLIRIVLHPTERSRSLYSRAGFHETDLLMLLQNHEF